MYASFWSHLIALEEGWFLCLREMTLVLLIVDKYMSLQNILATCLLINYVRFASCNQARENLHNLKLPSTFMFSICTVVYLNQVLLQHSLETKYFFHYTVCEHVPYFHIIINKCSSIWKVPSLQFIISIITLDPSQFRKWF